MIFTVDVPGQGLNVDAYAQILGTDGFLPSLVLSSNWPPPRSLSFCC